MVSHLVIRKESRSESPGEKRQGQLPLSHQIGRHVTDGGECEFNLVFFNEESQDNVKPMRLHSKWKSSLSELPKAPIIAFCKWLNEVSPQLYSYPSERAASQPFALLELS